MNVDFKLSPQSLGASTLSALSAKHILALDHVSLVVTPPMIGFTAVQRQGGRSRTKVCPTGFHFRPHWRATNARYISIRMHITRGIAPLFGLLLALCSLLGPTCAGRNAPRRLDVRSVSTSYSTSVYTTVRTSMSTTTSSTILTRTTTELRTTASLGATQTLPVNNGQSTLYSQYMTTSVVTSIKTVVETTSVVTSVPVTQTATITTTIPVAQTAVITGVTGVTGATTAKPFPTSWNNWFSLGGYSI